MVCLNLRRVVERVTTLGAAAFEVRHEHCELRMGEVGRRDEVDQQLLEAGLIDSATGPHCPLAASGHWRRCPYFAPKGSIFRISEDVPGEPHAAVTSTGAGTSTA